MIAHPDTPDGELLALKIATHFVLTESSRIQYRTTPHQAPGPLLYLAGCESGNVVCIREDIKEETARAIEALVADELPLRDRDSAPIHLDDYVELLSREATVKHARSGLVYTFPNDFRYDHDVPLIRSDTPEGDRLVARFAEEGMPEELVAQGFVDTGELWAPWCMALDGDEIASIAFTVGRGPASADVSAEAGVTTMPKFRRRGFGSEATAGWGSHPALRGRTLFYSTDRTNVASQRLAERIGLRFVGARLVVT